MEDRLFVGERGELLELKLFIGGEAQQPILGSLERTAFSYLGPWNRVQRKEGHGIMYKLGIKNSIIDAEGNPAVGLFVFYAPFVQRGTPVPPEFEQQVQADIKTLTEQIALAYSSTTSNVVAAAAGPTGEMLTELKTGLRSPKQDSPYA